MLRTIRLRGELGKRFGRVHQLAVDTPQEALRALMILHPDMRQFLMHSGERGVAYRCTADGQDLDKEELGIPLSKSFSITPVVQGAGALIKIIAGTILAVAAFALAGPLGLSMMATAMIGSFGIALALGGIAQLLAPVPKMNTPSDKVESQYFDGPVNITAQGEPVPFGYGRLIVGSKVISAGITVEDQSNIYNAYMGGFLGDRGYNVRVP